MTDSLNTALETLGQTMASNLTTMGVTASASDGLTTLSGKILNISGGGGNKIEITANKYILSYAESETSTITATYTEGAGYTLEIYNAHTNVKLGDMTDAGSGTYTYTYTSTAYGNISLIVKESTEKSNIITIDDCYRYDPANSDKTSTYGTPTVYRGSGSGTWNYNSTLNAYYGTISGNNEVIVPFTELTGEDDFIIEFDALFNNTGSGVIGIAGICAYDDSNNNAHVSCHNQKTGVRTVINGSTSETEVTVLTTVSSGDKLHYQFTITDNQIIEVVTKGDLIVGARNVNYTVTNSTQWGIALIWNNTWVSGTFLSNITVKSLDTYTPCDDNVKSAIEFINGTGGV